MSSQYYGPSLSDMGVDPDDEIVGRCAICMEGLDIAAMKMGGGVYDAAGRLLCDDCANGDFGCSRGCGEGVSSEGDVCAECAKDGAA